VVSVVMAFALEVTFEKVVAAAKVVAEWFCHLVTSTMEVALMTVKVVLVVAEPCLSTAAVFVELKLRPTPI
jgi:hypothetical protein